MIAGSVEGRRHGGNGLPWRTLVLTMLALALYLTAGAAPSTWVYDRMAIGQGDWWRLLSGHWVHSGPQHACWDIGALLVLGLSFESYLRNELFFTLILGTLGVDLWLWFVEPSLGFYCGLSAILNSLLALGLVRAWETLRHPWVWFTGAGAVVKILLEVAGGEALLTDTAWPSVPEVHGVGFACGLVLALTLRKRQRVTVERQVRPVIERGRKAGWPV
jgi:rhomboid family GlyGly-CTERM serine protease